MSNFTIDPARDLVGGTDETGIPGFVGPPAPRPYPVSIPKVTLSDFQDTADTAVPRSDDPAAPPMPEGPSKLEIARALRKAEDADPLLKARNTLARLNGYAGSTAEFAHNFGRDAALANIDGQPFDAAEKALRLKIQKDYPRADPDVQAKIARDTFEQYDWARRMLVAPGDKDPAADVPAFGPRRDDYLQTLAEVATKLPTPPRGYLHATGTALYRGSRAIGENVGSLIEQYAAPDNLATEFVKEDEQFNQQVRTLREAWADGNAGVIGRFAMRTTEMLPTLAVGAGLQAATGGLTAPFSFWLTQTAPGEVQKFEDYGFGKNASRVAGALDAAAQSAIWMFISPLERVLPPGLGKVAVEEGQSALAANLKAAALHAGKQQAGTMMQALGAHAVGQATLGALTFVDEKTGGTINWEQEVGASMQTLAETAGQLLLLNAGPAGIGAVREGVGGWLRDAAAKRAALVEKSVDRQAGQLTAEQRQKAGLDDLIGPAKETVPAQPMGQTSAKVAETPAGVPETRTPPADTVDTTVPPTGDTSATDLAQLDEGLLADIEAEVRDNGSTDVAGLEKNFELTRDQAVAAYRTLIERGVLGPDTGTGRRHVIPEGADRTDPKYNPDTDWKTPEGFYALRPLDARKMAEQRRAGKTPPQRGKHSPKPDDLVATPFIPDAKKAEARAAFADEIVKLDDARIAKSKAAEKAGVLPQPWQVTAEQLGQQVDEAGTTSLTEHYLYHASDDPELASKGIQPGADGQVWLSKNAPLDRGNTHMYAIDKAALEPDQLKTAENGFPQYAGEIPAAAVIDLGPRDPHAPLDRTQLHQRFVDWAAAHPEQALALEQPKSPPPRQYTAQEQQQIAARERYGAAQQALADLNKVTNFGARRNSAEWRKRRNADLDYKALKSELDKARAALRTANKPKSDQDQATLVARGREDARAGVVSDDAVQYAPLHELPDPVRNTIQNAAVELRKKTSSDKVRAALKKIIKDAGEDVGVEVEKQKLRLDAELLGESQRRPDSPPVDPLYELFRQTDPEKQGLLIDRTIEELRRPDGPPEGDTVAGEYKPNLARFLLEYLQTAGPDGAYSTPEDAVDFLRGIDRRGQDTADTAVPPEEDASGGGVPFYRPGKGGAAEKTKPASVRIGAGDDAIDAEVPADTNAGKPWGGLKNLHGLTQTWLVDLANTLTGAVPQLQKLPKALGMVKFKEGNPLVRIILNPKLAKTPGLLSQALRHEIGHVIDFLHDLTLNRGNLARRLLSLHGVMPEALDKLDNDAIKRELVKLTQWWSGPIEGSPARQFYRTSPRELYAEAWSVLLNDPLAFKERAPLTFEALGTHLSRKPGVWEAFIQLQHILDGTPEELAVRLQDRVDAMGFRWDQVVTAHAKARQEAERSDVAGFLERTVISFLDQYYGASKFITLAANKFGVQWSDSEHPYYILDELFHVKSAMRRMYEDIEHFAGKPMRDAGVTRNERDAYATAMRIMTDRAQIANPLGLEAADAGAILAHLAESMGPAKLAAVQAGWQYMTERLTELGDQAVASGLWDGKVWEELRKNSNTYVPFLAIKYYEDGLSPQLKRQEGTFEEIGRSWDAMTLKLTALSRAIAFNDAKVAIAEKVMKPYFPEDFNKVETNDKTKMPDGHPRAGYDFLHIWEGGKIAHYEVPENFAKGFKRAAIGDLAWIARFVGSPAYRYFHPLLTVFSPSFMTLNPTRDFKRLYHNLTPIIAARGGKASFLDVLKAYKDSLPLAHKRALGIRDAEINRLADIKALNMPFAVPHSDFMGEGLYERLLHEQGIRLDEGEPTDPTAVQKLFAATLGKLSGGMEYMANLQETVSKIAAVKLLESRTDMGPRELAYTVRKYAGTPDLGQRGTATVVSNALFMYARVRLNGMQHDLAVASDPKTRGGWWWRRVIWNALPMMATKAAAYGMFGQTIQTAVQNIPSYFLKAYNVIPVGWSGNGDDWKTQFLKLPYDDTGRLISSLVGDVMDGIATGVGARTHLPNARAAISEAFGDLYEYLIPSTNPIIDIASKWMQYAMGIDPIDMHFGQKVVPERQWEAGGTAAAGKMMAWTTNKFGVLSLLARPITGQLFGAPFSQQGETTYETVIRSIPFLSSFLSVSNQGQAQLDYAAENETRAEAARFRLGLPAVVQQVAQLQGSLNARALLKVNSLTPSQDQVRAALNEWHQRDYLKLTAAIKTAQAAGASDAALVQQLQASAELARTPEGQKQYLEMHLGELLLSATAARPAVRKLGESQAKFDEQVADWKHRTQSAALEFERLGAGGLTYPQRVQLMMAERKRRGDTVLQFKEGTQTDFGKQTGRAMRVGT